MRKISLDLVLLAFLVILSTYLVWLPFAFGLANGMFTLFANYDGPNYIVAAKTLYDKTAIASAFSLPLPLEYYPAHLPGYPLLIKFLDVLLPGTWAMLLVTLATTILATWFFYLILKKFNLASQPLWLAIIFLFLPARWLVVRTIGSPEPLFIFAILASFYFFKSAFDNKENNLLIKKKSVTFDFLLAGLFGAVAQITKTPGILLFVSYGLYLTYYAWKNKKIVWQALPLAIIPLALLPVFWFYQAQTGDFWAYFHSGDNFHLIFPPFQAFATGRNWLGDFWLEDIVFYYFIGALAIVLLYKQKLYDLAIFATVFFSATIFVSHRDVARYSLPLIPFYLIAFSPFIIRKEFKIAFLIALIPIYLYALNFISNNTAPIADWSPYL